MKGIKFFIVILLIGGCASSNKKTSQIIQECDSGGILVNDEDPSKINCNSINLFKNEEESLSWEKNTEIITLYNKNNLKIRFIYANDGRYYVYSSGNNILYKKTEAKLNVFGSKFEEVFFAFEGPILSGRGIPRRGLVTFILEVKLFTKQNKNMKKRLKFQLNL